MFYILQSDQEITEYTIIKELLLKNKYTHTFVEMTLSDFYKENVLKSIDDFDKKFRNAVPIGTIDFVEAYLKIFKNIERENAIEIPPILRTPEFLKRKYKIVSYDGLPKIGNYFIKDATRLKYFSFSGNVEFLKEEYEVLKGKPLDKTHLYVVSELVSILSEYRIYVIDGKIENIINYNGDVTIFPDMNLVNKAVILYNSLPNSPKSYSLDVMINSNGTSILEIHNFTSLGLYSTLWGANLLNAYKDGIDYLVNYNVEQTEFLGDKNES